MVTRRVEGVLFTDEEQRLIKEACEKYSEPAGFVNLNDPDKLTIPPVLAQKLRAYGCLNTSYRDGGYLLTTKVHLLVEEFNEPIDYWEWLITWFKTRPWAIPVGAIVVGLPILWQYIEWIGKLIDFLQTQF